jgi:hypothetical protein
MPGRGSPLKRRVYESAKVRPIARLFVAAHHMPAHPLGTRRASPAYSRWPLRQGGRQLGW